MRCSEGRCHLLQVQLATLPKRVRPRHLYSDRDKYNLHPEHQRHRKGTIEHWVQQSVRVVRYQKWQLYVDSWKWTAWEHLLKDLYYSSHRTVLLPTVFRAHQQRRADFIQAGCVI